DLPEPLTDLNHLFPALYVSFNFHCMFLQKCLDFLCQIYYNKNGFVSYVSKITDSVMAAAVICGNGCRFSLLLRFIMIPPKCPFSA
ncbi:MAG: hypothetical protein J6A19_12940, partial [Oscillospiraceae bacterium]|nr:hypothetical protein [Oscillospiraceae bacterium]